MVPWSHPEIRTGDTGEGGQGIPIVDYSVLGTMPGLSQEAVGAIHIFKVAAVVVVGTCFLYDLPHCSTSTPAVVSVWVSMVVGSHMVEEGTE